MNVDMRVEDVLAKEITYADFFNSVLEIAQEETDGSYVIELLKKPITELP